MQIPLLYISTLTVISTVSLAQVITVNTIDDISDTLTTVTVEDLPGPDGKISMREATLAANNTPGPQTIEFAIPESEFWTGDGVALLRLEYGLWFITDDETTIDFSSQERNIGDTNPTGPEVGAYGFEVNGWGHPALIIAADNCVIEGMGHVALRTPSIEIRGNHNRVIGCKTLGVEIGAAWQEPIATNNIIGGTSPEEKNDLNFIDILSWADDNIVIGNQIRSIRIAGTDFTHYPSRNRIGGTTPEERNVISGFGSYGTEGFPTGEGILVNFAQDTLIQGNYIGTTADGMSGVSQRGPNGIEVRDSFNTTIIDNLISGLYVEGVNHANGLTFGTAIRVNSINADNMGVTIQGNLIGTDATGQSPIHTYQGIALAQSTGIYTLRDTLVGGTQPGQGNTIAFTDTTGIVVGPLTIGGQISGNSIHSNTRLGIDLLPWSGTSGPTPNDPMDTDTQGGNAFQNYPEIMSAETTGSSININAMLESIPFTEFSVEFFASPQCDPSGFGEGQIFLGTHTVTTDSSGFATMMTILSTDVPGGWVLTSTATDTQTGNTSEFSECIALTSSGCMPDMNDDGALDFFDVSIFLTSYAAHEPQADITNNGSWDFFDISAFLNTFALGCP
ncbi:MAG: GC-type dockerin domain-anchored protein [Phycisphaerales bacterium]